MSEVKLYPHEKTLAAEGLQVSDIPAGNKNKAANTIRLNISNFNRMKKSFGETPTDDQEKKLVVLSIGIHDMITEYLDKDLDEEEEEIVIQQNPSDMITEENKTKIAALKTSATAALNNKDYKAAIAAYQDVLNIDPEDGDAKAQIPAFEQAMADEAAAAAATAAATTASATAETNYNAIIATADAALAANNLKDAAAAYTQAAKLSDKTYASDQLAKIAALEADAAATAAKAKSTQKHGLLGF